MYLDFVRPVRVRHAWGMAALALAVVVAVLVVVQRQQLVHTQSTLEEQITALRRKTDQFRQPDASLNNRQFMEAYVEAEKISRRLVAPWQTLLDAIESTQTTDIALLTIDAQAERRTAILTGEARHYGALLDYMRQLQSFRGMDSIALQSHQVNRNDRERPIRFRLQCNWGGTP